MRRVQLNGGRTRVAFGEVVKLSKERSSDPRRDGFERYVGLDHIDPGELKIRRWGDTSEGTTFTSVFRPGHVLFGKRRAYQHKVAVADFSGVCSGDIYVFEPRNSQLLPDLLPFICQTDGFFEHALGTSAGSLSPRTNWKSLATYEFALPPLEEQKQITEAFAASEAVADALRAAREGLESCERSYLIDAFGAAPGRCPPGLSVVVLGDLAQIQTGLAKGLRPDLTTTTLPYLRVANVKDGRLDLGEIKRIVVEKDKVGRYSLHSGDVLMTEGGDLDKLGRGTVWQDEIQGCLHQNHIFAVRAKREVLDPWYLAAVARSTYGRAYFLSCAKRTSNLASVNKTQLQQFPVPLMEPNAQRKWLAVYQSVRAGVAVLEGRVAEVKGAQQRLLGQLIGGAA
jgi:type I restriction enzyme S subunit